MANNIKCENINYLNKIENLLTNKTINLLESNIIPLNLELNKSLVLSNNLKLSKYPKIEIYKIINWDQISKDVECLKFEIKEKLRQPKNKYCNYQSDNRILCRRNCFFSYVAGHEWNYGMETIKTNEYTPTMRRILQSIDEELKLNFYNDNQDSPAIAICNEYPAGNFGITAHRDNSTTSDIISLNIGLSIKYLRIESLNKRERYDFGIEPGMMYILRAPTNEYYTHSILARKTSKPTITITWRKVNLY